MSYVSEIAEAILSHSEEKYILGPEVYTKIAEWEKLEIPTALVLQTIEDLCSGDRSGKALGQLPLDGIDEAVARDFSIWLKMSGPH
jgi:hypothetical protein